MGYTLTKSKYIRGLQCLRALYYDIYHPKWAHYDKETLVKFQGGRNFEAAFKQTFRSGGIRHIGGRVEEVCGRGENNALNTKELLAHDGPVTLFEAGFIYDEVLVLADVLQRDADGNYTIYEVKNSTEVKPVLLNDIAIQHYVITQSIGQLKSFNLVHNDGNDGFVIIDQQSYAAKQHDTIAANIANFKKNIQGEEPNIGIGEHCQTPYPCPYLGHCSANNPNNSAQ